jgi:hypothetical protein
MLSRLVDLPTFLIILPNPRKDRFWRGGTGLSATLRKTGAPEEHNTRGRPELMSTCFARRGRIRYPHIPMSSTPGMPRGIRRLTLRGPLPTRKQPPLTIGSDAPFTMQRTACTPCRRPRPHRVVPSGDISLRRRAWEARDMIVPTWRTRPGEQAALPYSAIV